MKDYADIYYTDYCDFPRAFVVTQGGVTLLFDGGFDEATDEYPDEYRVFLLPQMTLAEARQNWSSLRRSVLREIGRVRGDRSFFAGEARHWRLDVDVIRSVVGAKK